MSVVVVSSRAQTSSRLFFPMYRAANYIGRHPVYVKFLLEISRVRQDAQAIHVRITLTRPALVLRC
jgi:hypothetical protein